MESNRNQFIIFSDSLSTLHALHNMKILNPCVCNILERISHLQSSKEFVFCWIPGHIGIKGNEKADANAKSALTLPISNVRVPYTDFKSTISFHMGNSWQSQWDADIFKKLHYQANS